MPKESLFIRLRYFNPVIVTRWPGNDGEERVFNSAEAQDLITESMLALKAIPNRVDFANADSYADAIDQWLKDYID